MPIHLRAFPRLTGQIQSSHPSLTEAEEEDLAGFEAAFAHQILYDQAFEHGCALLEAGVRV